jgi:parallel beta-helix repeat protein
MKRKTVVFAIVLAVSMLIGIQAAEVTNANPYSYPQSLPEIVIASDGSVNPPTDSINHAGNTYSLIKDVSGIYCLTILCNGIVFDGAGHSFVGGQFEKPTAISVANVSKVTIKNMDVSEFFNGIALSNSSGCLIENVAVSYCYQDLTLVSSNFNQVINCTFKNMYKSNYNGVSLSFSDGNILTKNSLISNQYGIQIFNCQNNVIYKNTIETSIVAVYMMHVSKSVSNFVLEDATPSSNYFYLNSFVNNSLQFTLNDLDLPPLPMNNTNGYFNYWSYNGYGNYWSDYSTKYTNASEIGNTGIGDTPYFIAQNNIDSFPLVRILSIEYSQTPLIPTPLPTLTPSNTIPTTSSNPKPTREPEPTTTSNISPTPTMTTSPTSNQSVDSNNWINPIFNIAIAIAIVIVAVASISLVYFRRRRGKQ